MPKKQNSKSNSKKIIHHKIHSVNHTNKKNKTKKSIDNNQHKETHTKATHTIKKTIHHKQLPETHHKTQHKITHKNNTLLKTLGTKFCPKCGKSFKGSAVFCKECNFIDFDFKDIKLVLCNSCRSYFHKNIWKPYANIDLAVKKIAYENINARVTILDLPENDIEKILDYKAGIKKEHILEVSHNGGEFEIPFIVEVTLCNKCSKKGTKYFEGILQLRNSNEEINDFVRKETAKQSKKGIYINNETKVNKYSDENIDFSITDQTYIKVLAEKIKSIYGARIKKNAQHFSISWETTKILYRLNVLVEIPKYKKNEVIKVDSNLFKIVSLGDSIHVVNLKTNSKTSLQHKDSYDVLKPVNVQVIKLFPEVEILDPTTYYQARLINPSKELKINEKIKVFIDAGEAWMV